MTYDKRYVGGTISVQRGAANTAVTAAGAGDATEVVGAIIDRAAFGWPESMVAAVPWTATLAAAATLTIATVLQHGDQANLSDAVTFNTTAAVVVGTGAGTLTGCLEVNMSLRGAKRYVRQKFTPDLSAASIDTAALSGVVVLGGAERLPQ